MAIGEVEKATELVREMLTADGSLDSIKAKVRAHVIRAMYDEPTTKIDKSKQDKEAMFVIKEYMLKHKLIHTLSVLEKEWGTDELEPTDFNGTKSTILEDLITSKREFMIEKHNTQSLSIPQTQNNARVRQPTVAKE